MVIYKITNQCNGKCYIGQTRQEPKNRWKVHCSLTPTVHKSAIRSAIKKYGRNSFSFEILAKTDSQASLNALEIFYIEQYNSMAPNGYNLIAGGGKSGVSDITRQRLSELAKKRPKRKQTQETKEKIRRVSRKRMKAVVGEHTDTGSLIFLESFHGDKRFHPGGIWACCNGKSKIHRNYRWRYLDETHL